MPKEIMGHSYEAIKEALVSFAKTKAEWDEYAKKINPALRARMAKCFDECREEGFYGPHIGSDGEIKFAQVVYMRQGIGEVYLVEIEGDAKRVAKEYLTPDMKIIKRVR